MSYRTIVEGSGRWMVLGLLLALAAPLEAQQQRGDRRGPRAGAGVERSVVQALARAESLGLDEARVAELTRMRDELREMRTQERGRHEALRLQYRDGSRALRQEMQPRRQAVGDRFQELLSEDERRQLREGVARDRRGRMDRGGAGNRPRSELRCEGRGGQRIDARRHRTGPRGGTGR